MIISVRFTTLNWKVVPELKGGGIHIVKKWNDMSDHKQTKQQMKDYQNLKQIGWISKDRAVQQLNKLKMRDFKNM